MTTSADQVTHPTITQIVASIKLTKLQARTKRMGAMLVGALALAATALLATPSFAAPLNPKDPFAGDTWHAVQKSWPGTMRFEKGSQTVTLEPLGGRRIVAGYSFKITKRQPALLTGTLLMVTEAGEKSQAQFTLSNSGARPQIELQFPNGAVEHYEKMTAKEEAAAVEQLKKQLLAK